MTLLQAVNKILSLIGESQVVSLEIQHPTIFSILDALELYKQSTLEQGWWFNKQAVTMYPNTDNEIEAPINALFISSVSDTRMVIARDGMLFDASNATYKFTGKVLLDVVYNVDFKDLPLCAQDYIVAKASYQVYSHNLGVDNIIANCEYEANAAYARMQRMHLRELKYTIKDNKAYQRYTAALKV